MSVLDSMSVLIAKYPKAIYELYNLIDRLELDCTDNYRVAKSDDSWEKAAYYEAQSSGCCGCFDEEIIVDGETFLVGCNYGH